MIFGGGISLSKARDEGAEWVDKGFFVIAPKMQLSRWEKIFEVVGMQSGSGFANIWFFELACEKEKNALAKN